MKNTCNIVLLRRAAGRFSFPVFVTVMVGASSLFTVASLQAEPPAITCQPQHHTNVIGSTITLTVCATGTPPLAYQWFRGSGILPQGTNATLLLSNVQPSQAGNHRVVITNSEGAVTSEFAYVSVLVPPSITAQPTNFLTLSLGASVSNRVLTTGTAPLGYQWRRDGVNVPGQTNREIAITNLQLADAGLYTVVVANSGGSITSAPVMLAIDPSFLRTMYGELNSAESGMWNPYWVDYNQDSRLDLIVCGGGTAGLAPRPLIILDNLGDGVLQRNRTNALALVTVQGGNLVWADFDNDGDPDLYVTHEESLPEGYFRNDGQGRFTRIVAAPVSTAYGWTAAAADYDEDGWLDLLVGCWGAGVRTNRLLRGVGGGRFEVDAVSGLNLANIYTDSVAWVDHDEDGDLDVLIGISGFAPVGPDRLMVNNGQGVFASDVGHPLVLRSSVVTVGQTWVDYDNDGDLDAVLCRWEPNRPLLYRNLGEGNFEEASNGPRTLAGGRPVVPQCGDYDNDGHLDLFISQDSSDGTQRRGRLFHNRGDGTFDEISTGSPVMDGTLYGSALADYDVDGFLDLAVVSTQPGVNFVYRNNLAQTGNSNAWLKVRLVGSASNRSGVGAVVRARAAIGSQTFWQRRQIVAKANEPTLEAHFGLGDATNVETLRVEWPSGQVTELHDVAPRQFLTITEEPRMRMTKYAPGDMQIEITAHVGMNIELRVTNDLPIDFRSVPYTNWPLWTNWVPWKTVLQTNRTMIVIDPEASQYPRRFYGARVQ